MKKKKKNIDIITPSYEEIQSILKEKMKIYQKKSGKLPDIDIVKVEQEIDEKEKELNKEEANIDKVMNLMFLYQKAIEYYSAINDNKFIDFTNKIHKLLENSKVSSSSSTIENKDNKKIEPVISNKENIKVEDENLKKEKEKNNEFNNNKDSKKDTNKETNVNDIKEEKKNKIEDNKMNKNDIKEQNGNNDDKDIKEENNISNDINKNRNHPSIKLKISDEDLKTLDVGDEEEEEEEGEQ